MKQIMAILMILSLVASTSCRQRRSGDDTYLRVENYLSELGKAGFSGSVLVEIDGKFMLSEGYGFSNVDEQQKNLPATIFDIGSVTKQFTAAAILKLEMEGRLSTSDNLSRFFDNVPADKADITIHDLLRHQSGLVSVVGGDYERIDEKEFLDTVFASPLLFETGNRFSYSNIGYSILALIIEKVSSQDYETYLYENLWKPALMETTGYTRPRFDTTLIATG
jgi:CubicO group peptidase (beta-lactamase class C family)